MVLYYEHNFASQESNSLPDAIFKLFKLNHRFSHLPHKPERPMQTVIGLRMDSLAVDITIVTSNCAQSGSPASAVSRSSEVTGEDDVGSCRCFTSSDGTVRPQSHRGICSMQRQESADLFGRTDVSNADFLSDPDTYITVRHLSLLK